MIGALRAALAFYTRLPVGRTLIASDAAQAAAPLAGAAVALIGTTVWGLGGSVGLPPTMAAGFAILATITTTGGLHEDGLADTADSLGGADRERRLAIMRDSRIGSFGTLALILSVGLRWAALASLPNAVATLIALVAAHAASRACLPVGMALLAPARHDGLSAVAGRLPPAQVAIAAALGVLALLPLGRDALVAAVGLALLLLGWRAVCRNWIGGQTGDTLGALQQSAEIAVLAVAAAHFGATP